MAGFTLEQRERIAREIQAHEGTWVRSWCYDNTMVCWIIFTADGGRHYPKTMKAVREILEGAT